MSRDELIEELKRWPTNEEVELVGEVALTCNNCEGDSAASTYFKIDCVDSVPPRIRLLDGRLH